MTKLHSITAVFKKPDEIIYAAKKISESGFKNFDVHTPYPVHGMDDAMALPSTKLPYVSLIFGLLGGAGIFLFMVWASSINYPLVIGGKPLIPVPALIPIVFECSVLLCALATVASLIAFFCKLPYNSNPLHDTSYMKKVSCDHFGIVIEASDPKFQEGMVKKLLSDLGGIDILSIPLLEEKPELTVTHPTFSYFLGIVAILTMIGMYLFVNIGPNTFPMNWMSSQDKTLPQSRNEFFKDNLSMRNPVVGTVARGYLPYPYKGKPEMAGVYLTNPFIATREILERGKTSYLVNCSACHGNFGKGDGRLRNQFPQPPSLHSKKVREWSDGRLFHVITEGQNSMPSYAKQIPVDDRWEIIHFVRTLQRSLNAKESDLQ